MAWETEKWGLLAHDYIQNVSIKQNKKGRKFEEEAFVILPDDICYSIPPTLDHKKVASKFNNKSIFLQCLI